MEIPVPGRDNSLKIASSEPVLNVRHAITASCLRLLTDTACSSHMGIMG